MQIGDLLRQARGVKIDAQRALQPSVRVPNEYGRGAYPLPVRGCEIIIGRIIVLPPVGQDYLPHKLVKAVTGPAPGHGAVGNVHNGMLRVVQIMQDDFAV